MTGSPRGRVAVRRVAVVADLTWEAVRGRRPAAHEGTIRADQPGRWWSAAGRRAAV